MEYFIAFILIWVLGVQGGGRGNFTPPCWFSLNNSETIKVATLTFCWIHSIRDIRAKFSIPSSPKSPDTGKN